MESNFYETWLYESPKTVGIADYYDLLCRNINELIRNGIIPEYDDLNKIELESIVYYWLEDKGKMQIVVLLEKKPQGLVVSLLGKRTQGVPPYADELYSLILMDCRKGIRLFSDNQVTDKGLKVWKRLLRRGYKILAYDGSNYAICHTEDDLDKNYHNDARHIRFVLTEPSLLWETKNYFDIQKIRDLVGYEDRKF